MKMKRNQSVSIYQTGVNSFKVEDHKGNVVLNDNEDYYIYMRNVSFKPNGIIQGIYLGDNPERIIDRHCKNAQYTDDWHLDNRKPIKNARLVAVKNNEGVIVIISN